MVGYLFFHYNDFRMENKGFAQRCSHPPNDPTIDGSIENTVSKDAEMAYF